MRLFTRRRAAALATAAALAAVGTLASAPGAAADDAGPWPGTEGKILTDGPTLVDPATGTATQVGTHMGDYAAWAPDGSRIVSEWGQLASERPDGSSRFSLPWATGVRSSAEQKDIAFW
ncbi:hypothetical protein [Streptomyces sp. CdTB01]|nr:hypothetical protein [Streptomyces sp. CdTB01]